MSDEEYENSKAALEDMKALESFLRVNRTRLLLELQVLKLLASHKDVDQTGECHQLQMVLPRDDGDLMMGEAKKENVGETYVCGMFLDKLAVHANDYPTMRNFAHWVHRFRPQIARCQPDSPFLARFRLDDGETISKCFNSETKILGPRAPPPPP